MLQKQEPGQKFLLEILRSVSAFQDKIESLQEAQKQARADVGALLETALAMVNRGISTGNPALDLALKIHGNPDKKLVAFYESLAERLGEHVGGLVVLTYLKEQDDHSCCWAFGDDDDSHGLRARQRPSPHMVILLGRLVGKELSVENGRVFLPTGKHVICRTDSDFPIINLEKGPNVANSDLPLERRHAEGLALPDDRRFQVPGLQLLIGEEEVETWLKKRPIIFIKMIPKNPECVSLWQDMLTQLDHPIPDESAEL